MVGHVSQCQETQNEMHDNKYYTAAGNATLGQCGLVVGMYAKVGPTVSLSLCLSVSPSSSQALSLYPVIYSY